MNENDILLDTGTNEFEIIEFFIDSKINKEERKEFFGVNVAKVLEVIEAPEGLKHSEGAEHPSFLGTISLRDLILPVIDLSVWLDVEREKIENELIVVTEINGIKSGFLVSGVTQIHRVSWGDLKPPSKYISELNSNCITGTIHLDERFILMIDLESILAELDPEMSGRDEVISVEAPEKWHAVIADDSVSVRKLLFDNFSAANFEVTMFKDGAEAWDGLTELNRLAKEESLLISDKVDIIIADVEMPQMDGYTLTKKIKDDPELSKLPVILFSSLISKGVEHKGERVKADAQVTKPEFSSLTTKAVELIQEYKKRA